MDIRIRDTNPDVISAVLATSAWIDASVGSILDEPVDAVVSPGNSFGFMDGGIDAVYTAEFGPSLQENLQQKIRERAIGELLVGEAIPIEVNHARVKFVICAPTMRVPRKILDPVDILLACRAATLSAKSLGINSLAFPGMGTGCGLVSPSIAAIAMTNGIHLALHPFVFPTSWREAQARHFQGLW